MTRRKVTKTGKDAEGDITQLCGPGSWSPRAKLDAIADIKAGIEYFVAQSDGSEADIEVVIDPNVTDGKYLRTNPDSTTSDNLDDLPDC